MSNSSIKELKKLPKEEQENVLNSFIKYIFKADKHSSYADIEDDYNKEQGEFKSYLKEYRIWVEGYLLAKENSIDSFLLRSMKLLNDESMVSSEIPVGVTIDQNGSRYLLRYINSIGTRSSDLYRLKSEWGYGLKKAGEVE